MNENKNITLLNIPKEIYDKYLKFKDIVKKEHGLSSQMYTAILFENALDEFLADPDVKKLVK